MTPHEVLQRFPDAKPTGESQYEARCPAHEDRTASLSIGIRGELTLVCCHAGCDTGAVLQAVGLEMKDLMPQRSGSDGNGKPRVIAATYDYQDEQGNLLYQAVRFFPKDFRQRRPDSNGGWSWSVKGCRKIPYRLPELLAADPSTTIYKVEGEKDSDRMFELGLVATCNVGGAGKWRREYGEHLRGRNVVILPDNDEPGHADAEQVARMLHGVAASVRIVNLPDLPQKGDVSDWLGRLGEAADPAELLEEMASKAPVWTQADSTTAKANSPPAPLREIVTAHPKLRPPAIDGLLRVGETMNVIAAPKGGKSWLASGLAMQVAVGGKWINKFHCTKGRTLLIDGELHAETIAHRLPAVANAMGLRGEEYLDAIDVWTLRGRGADLLSLGRQLEGLEAGRYSLVILDAWYRFLPAGTNENDNAAVMALYNVIDGYADRLRAGWLNIHHASKGNQADKSITDVGSGAGSQSRAADSHLAIRPHEEDDVAVLDAVVRSWPPVEPLAIRWRFPVWSLAEGVDPRKLRRPQTNRERQQQVEDETTIGKIIATFAGGKTQTISSICRETGVNKGRIDRLLNKLQADGRVAREEVIKRGNPCGEYRLAPAKNADSEPSQRGVQDGPF